MFFKHRSNFFHFRANWIRVVGYNLCNIYRWCRVSDIPYISSSKVVCRHLGALIFYGPSQVSPDFMFSLVTLIFGFQPSSTVHECMTIVFVFRGVFHRLRFFVLTMAHFQGEPLSCHLVSWLVGYFDCRLPKWPGLASSIWQYTVSVLGGIMDGSATAAADNDYCGWLYGEWQLYSLYVCIYKLPHQPLQ